MTKPDTFASEFIPPHAVTAWVDTNAVYVALPVKSGPPIIQSFALSEAGLFKALNTMRNVHKQAHGRRYAEPANPKIKKIPANKTGVLTKTEQSVSPKGRAEAVAVLRKLKII